MSERTQQRPLPVSNFNQTLVLWADKRIFWVSKHWLALTNAFFLLYVGLPVLAPILLAAGFTRPASIIYTLYRAACHQLPSRSYFIFGEQVAFCQRDVAIYATLFLGGLLFGLVRGRLRPIPLKWYVFFLVPIALDGGTQMTGGLLQVVSISTLWIIGLIVIGLISAILYSQKQLNWHSVLFLSCGPLALVFLQFYGPYHSDWLRRTLTGFIFGAGTVWFAYPYLEESFTEIRQEVGAKLVRASRQGRPAN